jgi:hypothetical protein
VTEDARPDPLVMPQDEFEMVKARLLELENAITWNTSCTSCARILDSANAERERAEKAEAKLAEITAAGAGHGRTGMAAMKDQQRQRKGQSR